MTVSDATPAGRISSDEGARDRAQDVIIGAGLMAASANVIMQLSHPSVGYGVVESRVESGQLYRHPIKRTRTTLTYIVVATLGTDEERKLFRRGVNRAHAQVRSTDSSPVSYNAFHRDLQMWVAACLYRGLEDTTKLFGPKLTDAEQRVMYQEAARLGTTLQVPEEMWPKDRVAFEEYWNSALDDISVDDTLREYLYDLAMLGFMPRVVGRLLGPFNLFVTTGFLPPRFREEMRLPWNAHKQRKFDRMMSVIGLIVRVMPQALRQFPYNLMLRDLRWRIRTGRALV